MFFDGLALDFEDFVWAGWFGYVFGSRALVVMESGAALPGLRSFIFPSTVFRLYGFGNADLKLEVYGLRHVHCARLY